MKRFYRTLFNGWKEISEQQEEALREYLNSGITALSGTEKESYINKRFRYEK